MVLWGRALAPPGSTKWSQAPDRKENPIDFTLQTSHFTSFLDGRMTLKTGPKSGSTPPLPDKMVYPSQDAPRSLCDLFVRILTGLE